LEFPVRTTVAACVFGCLYGLIYLASTTAFNSIITSAVLFLNISYAIPQAIVAIQGRSKVLPNRPFNLGRLGYICNIFSPLWITVMTVFVCFPPTLPATVSSMNYTAPIIVGLFICIIICWFTIGKRFKGPHIDWELLNTSNALEIQHEHKPKSDPAECSVI
jgi:choline transport protein